MREKYKKINLFKKNYFNLNNFFLKNNIAKKVINNMFIFIIIFPAIKLRGKLLKQN